MRRVGDGWWASGRRWRWRWMAGMGRSRRRARLRVKVNARADGRACERRGWKRVASGSRPASKWWTAGAAARAGRRRRGSDGAGVWGWLWLWLWMLMFARHRQAAGASVVRFRCAWRRSSLDGAYTTRYARESVHGCQLVCMCRCSGTQAVLSSKKAVWELEC